MEDATPSSKPLAAKVATTVRIARRRIRTTKDKVDIITDKQIYTITYQIKSNKKGNYRDYMRPRKDYII